MKVDQINWGDDSAEHDASLMNYFVRSTAFTRLTNKSKGVVVGRKGSGKSALRKALEQHFSDHQDTHLISISPSFNHIKNVLNANMTGFSEEIFFQHTWLRQIMLDCLCKIGHSAKGHYATESLEFARKVSVELNKTSKDFVENITDILSSVKAKAGSLGDFGLDLEKELRNIAEVDSLSFHLKALAQGGAKFVILIDDLDLGWNNSDVSNNLLLGLLAATASLKALSPENIYSCVFLREDVYSILIRKTQHSDKYRNIEPIRWDKKTLVDLLNARINHNRHLQLLDRKLDPFFDVFPETVGTSYTANWLIERTLERPRELIQLARYYTEQISGQADAEILKGSEQVYSNWKLDDLCTEYSNQYPGLIVIFQYWKTKFFRGKYHLKRTDIEEKILEIICNVALNEKWFNEITNELDVQLLLKIFYEVGFIGDFVQGGAGGSKTFYSFKDVHEPIFEEVQIHPCFRKAVNTVVRNSSNNNSAVPLSSTDNAIDEPAA